LLLRLASSREAPHSLGWVAEVADKGAAHPLGVSEADLLGDLFHRLQPGFHTWACGFGAQAFHRFCRGLTGFRQKHPAELARADASGRREPLHRQRFVQVFARESQGLTDAIGRRAEFHQAGELRLPTRTAVIHDQVPRSGACNVCAKVFLYQRQRQIDAGGNPGLRSRFARP
jgi:hypothetical protein